MAETKLPAKVVAKSVSSVQTPKKGNTISWVAPLVCVIIGFIIWRFIIGDPSNFTKPDASGGFWPNHEGAKSALARMYLGGIIVPILIGCLLTVLTFVVERFFAVTKATGNGNINEFIRKVQYHLANKNVVSAIAECDRQKGSVGNVMKAGLRKYTEMISVEDLDTEQKVLAIQKEVEEATAL
jgi:biopolymer transport protein ExbB